MEFYSEKDCPYKDEKVTIEEKKLEYLEQTVNESIEFINYGLDFLSKIGFGNIDLIGSLSFLNLSRSFELLMKCIICYKKYNNNRNNKCFYEHFPSYEEIKNYGHNIDGLRKEVLKNYWGRFSRKNNNLNYIKQLKNDRDFMTLNNDFIRILKIVSKYSNKGQYFNLDYITNKVKIKDMSPQFEMERLIFKFLKNDKQMSDNFKSNIGNFQNDDKIWKEITDQKIKPYLIKFRSALCRQFSSGILGDKARSVRSIDKYAFNK